MKEYDQVDPQNDKRNFYGKLSKAHTFEIMYTMSEHFEKEVEAKRRIKRFEEWMGKVNRNNG